MKLSISACKLFFASTILLFFNTDVFAQTLQTPALNSEGGGFKSTLESSGMPIQYSITNFDTVEVIDKVFIDNTTTNYGGAIVNYGKIGELKGEYINNQSQFGGAIYNEGEIVKLEGKYFDNGHVSEYGGAVFNANAIESINGEFVSNKANYAGGAVANSGHIVNLSGLYSENFAINGASIYNSGEIKNISGEFINNSSMLAGGALYNEYGNIGNINAKFINNSASSGGAISSYGSIKNISGEFVNNNAQMSGGAIYLENAQLDSLQGLYSGNSAVVGGAVSINGGSEIKELSGTFVNNKAKESGGAIYNAFGKINITTSGSDTIFSNNTANNTPNAIYNIMGTVNLNPGDNQIIFNDGISGEKEAYRDSVININKSDVVLSDGNVAKTNGTVVFNNNVDNNTINLYDGVVRLGKNVQNNTTYYADFGNNINFNVYGGAINLADNEIRNVNFGNLNLESDLNINVDAVFSKNDIKHDTLSAKSFNDNGHTINIRNIRILEFTKTNNFSISPIKEMEDLTLRERLMKSVRYLGDEDVYSPVFKYKARYNSQSAMIDFTRGNPKNYNSYNPNLFVSPIAAQIGGYTVQLNSYDEAFKNLDMYMLMPQKERNALRTRNHYASLAGGLIYDSKLSQYENKQGWFRPYVTFEKVNLNNGPSVSNTSYGTFFGGDSEIMEIKKGWSGNWGVYAGYNGSHQNFSGISIQQNGGTFGFNGALYKNNFYTGLTANVSAAAGYSSGIFGDDNFSMLMSGIASKTGYNFEFKEGRFIIQPNFLLSYSFVNAFDYTTASNVRISSNPLHAIQLEPGIKFIGNFKKQFQPYMGVSVVFNIIDKTHYFANDVALPNLSINPFVKYNLGIRKTWGEKITGFFQTYATSGGRNGVGFQAGINFSIGKLSKKQNLK